VKVIIIPDIASVNYGRGVGYEVREIRVDEQTAGISATEIRKQIMAGELSWQTFVDPAIHDLLREKISLRMGL
jgi:predicted nucleotidyltransferase